MNHRLQFGIPKRNYPHKLNFESDYDIQKANEQFQRALLGQNVVIKTLDELKKSMDDEAFYKNNGPNFNIFYDKTKSFFDNISCETREKQEGRNVRPDWKKERLTNQETFGPFAVRSQQAFYRSHTAMTSGMGGLGPANINRSMRWQPPPGQAQFMRFQQRNVRPDWKKERLTNQETFGPFAVRSQQAFYRSNTAMTSGMGGLGPANVNRPMRWQPPPGQAQFMRFQQ